MQVTPCPWAKNRCDSHHAKMQLMEKQVVDEGIDEVGGHSSYDLRQHYALKRGGTAPTADPCGKAAVSHPSTH